MKHINLTTYNDFENQQAFGGNISAYRTNKLNSAKAHVVFVKKLFSKKDITVLELGSGNSRTLFAFEQAGILKKGYGVEVSKARHEFAENWKKAGNFHQVENICADVLSVNFKKFESIDLCFCVDLAFQFFEPVQKGAALAILKNIYAALNPGGKIVLELDGVDRVLKRMQDNNVKLWEEFAEPDPWQYSLWDCVLDPKKNSIYWKKIFIKRNEYGISENEMVIQVYKKKDIQELLKKAGFSKIRFYANWKGSPYATDKGEYIVVANKK